MIYQIVIPITSAFLGAIAGYLAAMRTGTRTEAFRVFGQLKAVLIHCMLSIRAHENCPSENVMEIIAESEALLSTLTPFLGIISRHRIRKAWNRFAYGENPQYHDIRDTHHEYFSAVDTVQENRDNAFKGIHDILLIKI